MTAFSWTPVEGADTDGDALVPSRRMAVPTFEPEDSKARESPAGHPNARRVRDCYAAIARRDLETAFRDFSPGFKLEVPPQLPYDPGDVRGPAVVIGLASKMLELTGGQFKNELLSVVATDDMAVALNRVTVTRRGLTRVYHTTWTYRVVGDRFVEGWLHVSLSPEDLRAVFS